MLVLPFGEQLLIAIAPSSLYLLQIKMPKHCSSVPSSGEPPRSFCKLSLITIDPMLALSSSKGRFIHCKSKIKCLYSFSSKAKPPALQQFYISE
jgi:hypothetical protein